MSYTFFGKKVLKRVGEHIALSVYGLVGLGVFAATRGGSDKVAAKVPEVAASSDDEAKFLKDFIANLEKEDAGSKAHA